MAISYREINFELADRYKVPACVSYPSFARAGGLMSYGPDIVDLYRLQAGYFDRILKGEKPCELPCKTRLSAS